MPRHGEGPCRGMRENQANTWQKRMSTAAACARVVWFLGERVVALVPWIRPCATAQRMDSRAKGLTRALSAKVDRSPVGSTGLPEKAAYRAKKVAFRPEMTGGYACHQTLRNHKINGFVIPCVQIDILEELCVAGMEQGNVQGFRQRKRVVVVALGG